MADDKRPEGPTPGLTVPEGATPEGTAAGPKDPPPPPPPPPPGVRPASRWQASPAVVAVIAVLAAVVVGGLGFAAGYAVRGDDHHHRHDVERMRFMHDDSGPGMMPPFRGEFRVPMRGEERQAPAEQPSTSLVPTPAPTP